MIPALGFTINDFFAAARFAFDVYEHIQLSQGAPKEYIDFKHNIHEFGKGLERLHEILQEHHLRIRLFNSGVSGTADTQIQRTLSEAVGDFKRLEENTKKFLLHYKFMVQAKKGGGWAWKKVKLYTGTSKMYQDMEGLKADYKLHTTKMYIVIQPLKFHLLGRLEDTLQDVQQTVNRIEQLARSLFHQNGSEPWDGTVTEESLPMSRELYGIPPHNGSMRIARRPLPIVTTPTASISSFTAHPSDSVPSAPTFTPSEWIWLHEQFAAALSRSVGLEQTPLATVLHEIVRWLEEGRRGISCARTGGFIDVIPFVHLCKASWLCGKLLQSNQYHNLQTLDPASFWHSYMAQLAKEIRGEFENMTKLVLKLPKIKGIQPPLSTSLFDTGLPLSIGTPGLYGLNRFGDESNLLTMLLPGRYDDMDREVTILETQNGDKIRVEDRIGHGTPPEVFTLQRSKTTFHPNIPFIRMFDHETVQRPHMILQNSNDSVRWGVAFTDDKQLNSFQLTLTGYKIVSQIKQVRSLTCYYHSTRTFRAKTDVYEQASLQIWHEMKRTPRLPRPRQPSTYSTFSTQSMPTTAWRDINPHSLDLPRAQRTTSMNSVTGDSASAMTSSTSSSNSSSKSSHTVTPKGPRIEQKPPSSKLVIFAKSANGGSIQGNVQGVEIMVMELDRYTVLSRDRCCTRRKPDPKDPNAPLCCRRVWIEKLPGSSEGGKLIRLLGFREPDSGDQMSEDPLGPGLPLVVDQWEEKSSRVQKVDYIGIEFHTDDDKRFFMKDYEDMWLLARATASTYI